MRILYVRNVTVCNLLFQVSDIAPPQGHAERAHACVFLSRRNVSNPACITYYERCQPGRRWSAVSEIIKARCPTESSHTRACFLPLFPFFSLFAKISNPPRTGETIVRRRHNETRFYRLVPAHATTTPDSTIGAGTRPLRVNPIRTIFLPHCRVDYAVNGCTRRTRYFIYGVLATGSINRRRASADHEFWVDRDQCAFRGQESVGLSLTMKR